MTIHHSQIKKAEKLGIELSEDFDAGGAVRAFWPKRALAITGASASDALAQMQAAIAVCDGDEYRMRGEGRLVTVTRIEDGAFLAGSPLSAVTAHKQIKIDKNAVWQDTDPRDVPLPDVDLTTFDDTPGNTGGYDGPFGASATDTIVSETKSTVEREDDDGPFVDPETQTGSPSTTELDTTPGKIERSEKGVALNGAIAYSEGTPAGDCPYSSETDDDEEYASFERWNEEWDNAADEAAEADEGKGGSVVAQKYRAKYAELGHPTHCGDWLANLLNNLCLTKKDTDLDRFEAICAANGVDTSKYKRDGVGWQGRIRMTGRNLLAKKVYLAGGVIKTPIEGAEPEYRAPADWMQMQRFKMPQDQQAAPIPAPAAAA